MRLGQFGIALALWAAAFTCVQAQEPAPVSFARDVAPILAKNCIACHGATDAKSDYRLHTFEALLAPGASTVAPVTASNLEMSELYRLVASSDAAERMPKDGDPLPPEQIDLLKRWIEQGAMFDGPSPQAALSSYLPREPHPAAPAAYPRPVPITAVALNPAGTEIAVGGYYEVTIWNAADGALLRRIGNVDQRTYGLAYSADGALLAIASGTPGESGEVKLVNPADGSEVRFLGSLGDVALDVAFSPAGNKLAACGADRTIRIYDVASGNQDFLIEDHADWVMAIAWSADGTRLASASRDKTSKLFDATTGESLITYPGHAEQVFGVAIRSDQNQVLSAGRDRQIHLWSMADASKPAGAGGFGGEVYKIYLIANMVFSCCQDRVVRVHQPDCSAQIRAFSGHNDAVFALSYNDGVKRLASGSFDGEVILWNSEDAMPLVRFIAAPGYVPPGAATAAQ